MNVEVRIGTLVLDGVELRRRERGALPAAVEEALGALLDESAGRAGPSPPRERADRYARTPRVEAIATQLAAAIHAGLPDRATTPSPAGPASWRHTMSALGPASGFPGTPAMLRGGLVRIDPTTLTRLDVVTFQYNPDTLTRTLQPRAIGGEPGDRLEVLRLTGPPHESIKLEAEIDATDQLEQPTSAPNRPYSTQGLLPVLATLERLITPPAAELKEVDALFDQGMFEVAPMESPLVVLVWGVKRVVPVLVGNMSITEEAFDPELQPIRVKVSFEFKVLTSNDLPMTHIGASLYIAYRQSVEQLAALVTANDVRPLGLEHLP